MTTFLKIAFIVFASISILFGIWFIVFNAIEINSLSLGQETELLEMTSLNRKEAMSYSLTYLLLFSVLTILGTYLTIKKKKVGAVLCFILIFIVFGIELYTDSLFTIRV